MNMHTLKQIIKFRNMMSIRMHITSSIPRYTNNILPRNVSEYKLPNYVLSSVNPKRYKFKRTSKELEDDQDLDSEEEEIQDSASKIITGRMHSLRVDAVLKAGLGMARNKVETLFYENKILVNGERINKKSSKLKVKDEVDVIRGSGEGPVTAVSRVVILSAVENDTSDGLIVKMKRHKHLTIEST